MKLHTDKLTTADLRDALRVTGLAARGVDFDSEAWPTEYGSRKRARRIDFKLVASPGYGRRYRNSGTRGAESDRNGYWADDRALLYVEWGAFLGEIFHRDPNAIANSYDGAADFERTAHAYWSYRTPGKPDEPYTVEQWRTMFVEVAA